MEFDIEKFIMLAMYKRKTEATEGTELLNQKIIRTLNEKENDKYLTIVETDTIKQKRMKKLAKNTAEEEKC